MFKHRQDMNGKIILTLFILFYHKEEVKSKKLSKYDELFMNEDLIFYEKEPNYRIRRQVEEETTEDGSGGPIFFNSTIFITTTTTKPFNPCDSNPCNLNATCVVKGNNYTCECKDGYQFIGGTCVEISTSTTTSGPTTTTTIFFGSLISGSLDKSIKSEFTDQVYNYRTGYSDLNILGTNFENLQIHENGFVSLNDDLNVGLIEDPTYSITNFKIPIIAPLWSRSTLDSESDILFGAYKASNLDNNIIDQINQRGYNLNQNDLVYSVTWKDIKQSDNNRATFQLFIMISLDKQTASAIFNYVKVNFESKPNIFIGFTDGVKKYFTSKFSVNSNSIGQPNLLSSEPGNTNYRGFYVYEIPMENFDQCSLWFNRQKVNNYNVLSTQDNNLVPCPLNDKFMNPYFSLYAGSKWQESNCYVSNLNSFDDSSVQQFCCYDIQTNELITNGKNAGFLYKSSNLQNLIETGNLCCNNQDWSKCYKFYELNPATQTPVQNFESNSGWGGGDPHLTTFDGFTYTFNGLGKFIFSRSTDKSFEIQALTSILLNVNATSQLTGTLFTSFAMKTSKSQLFQIDLENADKSDPYLSLMVNKDSSAYSDFIRNMAYYKEFSCKDDDNLVCTTVSQNSNGVQFLFENGMYIEFKISKVSNNDIQHRSWIVSSISFLNLPSFDYRRKLEGLMGNNNGDKNDDLISRTGQKPANSTERGIYNIAMSWSVTSIEDLFSPGTNSKIIGRSTDENILRAYFPTFVDELPEDSLIKQLCNLKVECIFDSMVSGLPIVGNKTAFDMKLFEKTKQEYSLSPPTIKFKENKLLIDWKDANIQKTLTAEIYDTNNYIVEFDIKNATLINQIVPTGLNKTVTITFIPDSNKIPVIGIRAKDDTDLTYSSYFKNFLICNCKSLSDDNECLYDIEEEILSPTASLVACKCDTKYDGLYCNKENNACLVANFCNRLKNFNLACESLSLSEQISTGREYKCVGSCPNGYTKDVYGDCIDIEECKNSPCPSKAKCVEKLGSYECDCGDGYYYNKNSNVCELIDFCTTILNTCDSNCTYLNNKISCSCFEGFKFDSSNNCVPISNAGCSNFGCQQNCFNLNGKSQCSCRKGYKLKADGKICEDINECDINNGGCPESCVNKPGSFECTCKIGSKFDFLKNKCDVCSENTYGFNCSQTCKCTFNSNRCDPVIGCVCNSGFTGVNCETFIDPCSNFTDTPIQKCIAKAGVPVFECAIGYVLKNNICERIDPCSSNPCPKTATCSVIFPEFLCTCSQGFIFNKNKSLCENINECSSNPCPVNSECSDLSGSYTCICKNGYKDSKNENTNPNCNDIDECKIPGSCKSTEICTNLIGSYKCEPITSTSASTSTSTSTSTLDSTSASTSTSTNTSDSTSASTSTSTSTSTLDSTSASTSTSTNTSDSTSASTSTSTNTSDSTSASTSTSTSTSTSNSTSASTSTSTSDSTSASTSTSTSTRTSDSTSASTSTSSSSSSSAKIISTTTIAPLTELINGKNDKSIKNEFSIGSYRSYEVFSKDIKLNIFESTFKSFRIHPNGFVSFNNQTNIIQIIDPTYSIENFNFPIIAPLWTTSVFDSESDIILGEYKPINMDNELLAKLRAIMTKKAISRGVNLDVYSPELIYSITWKNMKESETSNQRATFQLFITISYSQETAYAIFNYVNVDWNQIDRRNIFIGLTNGNERRITNKYSVNSDSNGITNLITSEVGNTGRIGIYFYDLDYKALDKCTKWFNSKTLSNYIVPTDYLKFFVTCPLTDFGMPYNSFYRKYTGRKWQNSNCYRLRTNSYYDQVIQQFCCYDILTSELIFVGKNSGFAYNSLNFEDLLSEGSECCNGDNWEQCSKFYSLYPRTILSERQILIIFGWGGGDPHFTTYDGFTYTFNGLGKYVFSQAVDKSFEIQALTSILANINGSTDLLGTLFTSFAMRTNRSKIFQVELIDADKTNPYLMLFVDKSNSSHSDFIHNYFYFKEFPCIDKPNEICTTVNQSEYGVQFLFENGLSLNLSISSVPVNKVSTRSWITGSVNFIYTGRFDYRGKLEGLMGNWNQKDDDDIVGRDGSKPAALREKDIYFVAETWKVRQTEDLFAAGTTSRTIGRIRANRQDNFRPVFIEDMKIDPAINKSCNANLECIFDATASGLVNVGKQTSQSIAQVEAAKENVDVSPPIIIFKQKKIELNWHDKSTIIQINAEITDTNDFIIEFDVRNVTIIRNDPSSGLKRTVSISFTPIPNQVPVIGIKTRDSANFSSSAYFSNFFICNCQSLSTENKCDYTIQPQVLSPSATLVGCRCDQYYDGIFCDKERNDCLIGDECNKLGDFKLKCEPLRVAEQKSTGRGYKCIGDCPKGFIKDTNEGPCIDIEECQNPNTCPKNAVRCVEKLGSYECVCQDGYRHNTVTNTCDFIDLCRTSANDCELTCKPETNKLTCTCPAGFNSNGKKCQPVSVEGCDTIKCEQLCANVNNKPTCFCRNGFQLQPNGLNCQDIDECATNNGYCPETCVNKIGSFECTCKTGTKFSLNKQICETCEANTFGFNCSQTCQCGPNSVRCDPIRGCVCNLGFTGTDCGTPVNACQGFTNTNLIACISREGKADYQCLLPGYDLVNKECVVRDNCVSSPCEDNSKCISSLNNFTCNCPAGLQYNYVTRRCDDILECLKEPCPKHSFCTETYGSYKCACANGFLSSNNDTKKPICNDIDECASRLSDCAGNEVCVNEIGGFSCNCIDGFILDDITSTCVQATTKQGVTTITTKPFLKDNTGLILVIILPIIAVLILTSLAGLVCICWYRMRSIKTSSKNTKDQKSIPLDKNNQQSMFEKKNDLNGVDLIDFNDNNIPGTAREQDVFDDDSGTTSHSAYRTSYLHDYKSGNNDEIFRALENNARSNQKTTIGRPQSIFTGSSFSLPTGYYEQTTPYGDFNGDRTKQYKIDGQTNNVISENDVDYELDDNDGFDAFDNDDDLDDIIEAFNPNVKIPRPKIQVNPLKIFKFGPKNTESEN